MKRHDFTVSQGVVKASQAYLPKKIGTPLRATTSGRTIPGVEPGQQIKRLRALAGWSQQELADAAAVEQTTVSDIETGRTRDPQARTVSKIMGALKERLGPAYSAPAEDTENAILRHRILQLEIELGRAQLRIEELEQQHARDGPASEPAPDAQQASGKGHGGGTSRRRGRTASASQTKGKSGPRKRREAR